MFWEKSFIKLTSIIASSQVILHQLLIQHSRYCCKNLITAILCVYVPVLAVSFPNNVIVQNSVLFYFQTRLAIICMHMCTPGYQMMVRETSITTNLWASFLYNMLLYWLANLLTSITFILASFLQAGEGNQQNNQPWNLFLL